MTLTVLLRFAESPIETLCARLFIANRQSRVKSPAFGRAFDLWKGKFLAAGSASGRPGISPAQDYSQATPSTRHSSHIHGASTLLSQHPLS